MHRLLAFFFVFSCLFSFGQNSLFKTSVAWISKADKATIDSYLNDYSYQCIREKDSLNLHILDYSQVKTEEGTQPVIRIILSDTAMEYISMDTYGARGQQDIVAGLKSGRFKSIGTSINGNFITTTYDNGILLVHEDYEAIPNPLGKGEIAYFRYRIFRKYGRFDSMNGEKTRIAADGSKISEQFRNGTLDGERIVYYPNGTIKRKENYRSGRLNGLASDYNDDGKLIHSSTHSYHWKYGMEKWYNREGALVKSLQWQRDIPVGTEKQTFHGKVIGSIQYVNGSKHGMAKVPVYSDAFSQTTDPLDTLNDAPLGIESVAYEKGFKNGKAVCTYFNRPDTMYVSFYKAGKLDSMFTRYGQDGVLYTTTFTNGSENGVRIFRIPSGPLKDAVCRIETYKDGKLNGKVLEYYHRESANLSETSGAQWKKIYREENYLAGIRNGQSILRPDSTNYQLEYYVNDQLNGQQEYHLFREGKKVRITRNYKQGIRTGEWITENLTDGIIETEHYEKNRKQGAYTKVVGGFKIEERFYSQDTLKRLDFFEANGNSSAFAIDFLNKRDTVLITCQVKEPAKTSRFSYLFNVREYAVKDPDTILAAIAASFKTDYQIGSHLNGPFMIATPDYEIYGNFKGSKWDGEIEITHLMEGIFERLTYQNGHQIRCFYTQIVGGEDTPYTGTFISAESGEKISVKKGLRHGWCIEYDSSKAESGRTKYVNGIAKKTIDRHLLPPPQAD